MSNHDNYCTCGDNLAALDCSENMCSLCCESSECPRHGEGDGPREVEDGSYEHSMEQLKDVWADHGDEDGKVTFAGGITMDVNDAGNYEVTAPKDDDDDDDECKHPDTTFDSGTGMWHCSACYSSGQADAWFDEESGQWVEH